MNDDAILNPPAKPSARWVALAGNPNSGKTTLFNRLTGSRYKVANYPGVTVEKREGELHLPEIPPVKIIDLPGAYSLTGVSLDEEIAAKELLHGHENGGFPGCAICVVDSTNLLRGLLFASELIDANLPLIAALNMSDLAARAGIKIYKELLAKELDIRVLAIAASTGSGVSELKAETASTLKNPLASSKRFAWLSAESPYRKEALRLGSMHAVSDNISDDLALLLGCRLLGEKITPATPQVAAELAAVRERLTQDGIDSYSFDSKQRLSWIKGVVERCSRDAKRNPNSFAAKLDSFVTHRVWGSLLLVVVIFSLFQSVFLLAQVPMAWVDWAINLIGRGLAEILPVGLIRSLFVDGVIAGVGSVLVFVPQIAILFFCLGLLEDSGYLARAAFMLDRLMRCFGLQGRSFMPLLSSFACAVPGIMATRSIPSRGDRLTTILVAPFMSCSARLPVYTVLIAAFIPPQKVFHIFSLQGVVMFGLYLLGVIGAAATALLLKATVFKKDLAPFVLELPAFRRPSIRVICREVWDRVTIFLRNAGTIILVCSLILWALASFPRIPETETDPGAQIHQSYAGRIGHFIEPAITPLGYNWEIGVAILSSFAAREVFVSSLATVYSLQDNSDDATSLTSTLKERYKAGAFSLPTALSLLIFYVFSCQCIATIAACKRETGSWLWSIGMFVYMTAVAVGASLITYQIAIRLS